MRNIIIFSIDTLRIDCIKEASITSFHKKYQTIDFLSTPTLDYFFKNGQAFVNAVSVATYTTSAHASLFTGLYPPSHKIRAFMDFSQNIPLNIYTLAELFKDNGWDTYFYSDIPELFQMGLVRGFDRVFSGDIREFLNALKKDRRSKFIFIHLFDVHDPYLFFENPFKKHDNEQYFEELKQLYRLFGFTLPRNVRLRPYDAWLKLTKKIPKRYYEVFFPLYVKGVSHFDKAKFKPLVERLFDIFSKDKDFFVILSDHGEGEYDLLNPDFLLHSGDVSEDNIRIPIILFGKGVALGKRQELVSIIDVFPTLIEIAGLTHKPRYELDGVSFLDVDKLKKRKYVFAEVWKTDVNFELRDKRQLPREKFVNVKKFLKERAVVFRNRKYIYFGQPELVFSSNHQREFVKNLYKGILLREPDKYGFEYFTRNFKTYHEVLSQFFQGEEILDRHLILEIERDNHNYRDRVLRREILTKAGAKFLSCIIEEYEGKIQDKDSLRKTEGLFKRKFDAYPFVSVIILNYNGEKVIKQTITSLYRSIYPKERFEVIVVDNNSKDRSRMILESLKKTYENLKIIYLKKNLGFAGGNNVGIKEAKGKYVVLLNNDCIVDQRWLLELVKTAEKDDKVFGVNPKILLYPRYQVIKVEKPLEGEIVEATLIKSKLLSFLKERKKKLSLRIEYSPSKNAYFIEVPFDLLQDKSVLIRLVFTGKDLEVIRRSVLRFLQNEKKNVKVVSVKRSSRKIVVESEIYPNFGVDTYDRIQNAGIVVFPNGYGRDIGAVVRYHRQEYEIDRGQYNKEKEVYAACGAASLYRKDVFERLGFLDTSFFMYYEDVDVSERARLLGYKIMYNHSAIVRHVHALSSGEWSPFFIYHAEKGRLLHMFFNFPILVFAKEYLKFSFKSSLRLIKGVLSPQELLKQIQYCKVALYFIFNMPVLVAKRLFRVMQVPLGSIKSNYKKLSSGYWLFSKMRK